VSDQAEAKDPATVRRPTEHLSNLVNGRCHTEGAIPIRRRAPQLHRGAGDANRTRTMSLGRLWRYSAVTCGLADLRVCWHIARERP
jgi:hypothetical protein